MISLEGVTKQYLYGKRTLGAVDLTVGDGEILAVLGGEGSGKTTLLKVMGGVTDYEGSALVDGEPIGKRPDNIQFVFDDMAIFPRRSFYFNLAYPLKIRGVERQETDIRVNAAAKALGVTACLPMRVSKLSLIDKKRLAIARLLVRDSKNILIDDITCGLSAKEAEELWSELAPILIDKAKGGGSVIFATESLAEAVSIADRIAVMSGGDLKQIDSPQRIYSSPASIWAAQAVDKYFHFERGKIVSDGDKLILSLEGGSADITSLRDKISPSYIGGEAFAGWHGEDYALDGTRCEEVSYVLFENGKFAHYTPSSAVVLLDERREKVCTLPLADKVMLFDIKSENSILL